MMNLEFFTNFFFFFCRMLKLRETRRIVGLSTSRSTNQPVLNTLALSPSSTPGLSSMITFAVWQQNSDWPRDDSKRGSSRCIWSKSWSTFLEIQPVDSAPSQVQTCSRPFPVLLFVLSDVIPWPIDGSCCKTSDKTSPEILNSDLYNQHTSFCLITV